MAYYVDDQGQVFYFRLHDKDSIRLYEGTDDSGEPVGVIVAKDRQLFASYESANVYARCLVAAKGDHDQAKICHDAWLARRLKGMGSEDGQP